MHVFDMLAKICSVASTGGLVDCQALARHLPIPWILLVPAIWILPVTRKNDNAKTEYQRTKEKVKAPCNPEKRP